MKAKRPILAIDFSARAVRSFALGTAAIPSTGRTYDVGLDFGDYSTPISLLILSVMSIRLMHRDISTGKAACSPVRRSILP